MGQGSQRVVAPPSLKVPRPGALASMASCIVTPWQVGL